MTQHEEPLGLRTTATVLDVIREYPDYARGSRRWDDRVFHQIVTRKMEHAAVRRAVRRVCRPPCELNLPCDLAYEPVCEVVASTAPMQEGDLRVTFFPEAYNEVDGVANLSRHFEAFPRNRGLAFLTIHAGPDRKTMTEGSVTRLQLPRSWLTFPAGSRA
jgi:hypothetical protein